jgi:uncharacterized protein YdhG (YjbR/CyaY superfamily)
LAARDHELVVFLMTDRVSTSGSASSGRRHRRPPFVYVPGGNNGRMDQAVQDYIAGIDPSHRPLFDRVHRLILAAHPEAAVVISYQLPTYKVGRRRLHVGAWKHGVSIYGWPQDRDGGFTTRHPKLKTSKGTIQLRPEDAASIGDDELVGLINAALEA